jgi:hypothetical protein
MNVLTIVFCMHILLANDVQCANDEHNIIRQVVNIGMCRIHCARKLLTNVMGRWLMSTLNYFSESFCFIAKFRVCQTNVNSFFSFKNKVHRTHANV